MFFGVDQRLEVEQIGAAATNEYIIPFNRLVFIIGVGYRIDLIQGVVIGIPLLGNHRFATVGAADQQIVQVTDRSVDPCHGHHPARWRSRCRSMAGDGDGSEVWLDTTCGLAVSKSSP